MTNKRRPKVSVYIPCHDYGRFVASSISSVLDQSFTDLEVIVVDDGSVDDSGEVIRGFAGNARVRTFTNAEPLGLRRVANQCIHEARGELVMRLDADDRLHSQCIELLVAAADDDPDAGLFFSDYYYLDDRDSVLGVECLPRDEQSYRAHSFPPHGACLMARAEVLSHLGPYDEDLRGQDGHELWLKALQAGVRWHHVDLPLFYYRQHGDSLSSNLEHLLPDRAEIKRRLAVTSPRKPTFVAMLPVKNTYKDLPDIPFVVHRGRSLLDAAIEEAAAAGEFVEILVSTDCPRVHAHVTTRWPDVVCLMRPPEQRQPNASVRDILADVASLRGYDDDVVVALLSVHTPFRRRAHIQKALDNFRLFDVDSVVTVYEERSLLYQMGEHGLVPLNPSHQYRLRRQREAVYIDNGAVRVFPVGNLRHQRFLGTRIGHALMAPEDGFNIKSPHDLELLLAHGDRDALAEA